MCSDATKLSSLKSLNWDTSFMNELPMKRIVSTESTSPVPDIVYCYTKPTPVEDPEMVCTSEEALQLLDIDVKTTDEESLISYLSGNNVFEGTQPVAHCYCGHQFGSFSGQLGDGRAMTLGNIVNKKGERWELQLKGAGQTPFSRNSDGRAVLRSSIREFLCSEAMHGLGIPTTRAATLIASSTRVIRDIFYNGNQIREKASIVLRLSPSFIRFGSFEIAKDVDPRTGRAGPSNGKHEIVKALLDYTIKYHFSDLVDKYDDEGDRYVAFYKEIVERTAKLVAEWQCVGFCHGVLNTDNMSVHGVTIDYGPFGFLDNYNPEFICNGSDNGGRYSYENQPSICGWNLGKLGEMLLQFVDEEKLTNEVRENYEKLFRKYYHEKMYKKLGLFEEVEGDNGLVDSLLNTMKASGTDFTNAFRGLNIMRICTDPEESVKNDAEFLEYVLAQTSSPRSLALAYKPMYSEHQLAQLQMLAAQNPMLLMAMGQDPEAVVAQINKFQKYKKLQNLSPEDKEKTDKKMWREWIQKYRVRITTKQYSENNDMKLDQGQSELDKLNSDRTDLMDQNNPKYILRNYIAEEAIRAAEKGDYSEVQRVHKLLKNPYVDQQEYKDKGYDQKPPDWSFELNVT